MKRIVTGDGNLKTIQDNVQDALAKISHTPFQAGILFSNVSLASGSTQISHKLGRQPQGWVVTDLNGAATIYRSSWDSKYITLSSSAAVTASLWVF